MNEDRLEQLLAGLLDDSASPEELEELSRLASGDDEALEQLRDQLRIDEGLRQLLDATRRKDLFAAAVDKRLEADADQFEFLHRVLDRTDERVQRNFFRRMGILAGILACTSAMILAAVILHQRGGQRPQAAEALPAPRDLPDADLAALEPVHEGVAVVQHLSGTEWELDRPLRVGDSLSPGTRLKLRAGSLQVQFYRGTVLTLEGPVDVEILSVNDAVLHAGKAWAKVPLPAQGFTLHTPDVEVVDLGTEFGVEVHPGERTEVSVFSGEVELYRPDSGRDENTRVALITGQGMVVRGDQRTPIDVDRGHFSSEPALQEQRQRQLQQQRQRWEQWRDAARHDPRVLIHYLFEPSEENRVEVRDLSHSASVHGYVVGCQWSAGRWPDTHSLDFKRPGDRVRFRLDGEYEAVTLAAWIRIDGLDRSLSSLMLTDGFELGELHWQFNQQGSMGLAIEGVCNHYSPTLFNIKDLGKWMHVATTYDSEAKQARLYFNGEPVDELTLKETLKVRFGDAELGNWNRPVSEPPFRIRNFNGRMDEFLIYRVALSEVEIREMYEAGKPD